jgi:hypothetical protein
MAFPRPNHLLLPSSDRYGWRIVDFTLIFLVVTFVGALAAIGAAILPAIVTF